jgi:hypothetical protein
VSTKQAAFSLGIKLLSPTPILADAGIAGTAEKLLDRLDAAFLVPTDLALDQFPDEFGKTLAATGRFNAGADRKGIVESDGYVLHGMPRRHGYRGCVILCQAEPA